MSHVWLFDEWILDKHQRFADWMTRKTGVGRFNFKLSKVCLTIFIVGLIIQAILKNYFDGEIVVFVFFMFGYGLWYDWDIQKAQRDEVFSNDGARWNPQKEKLKFSRLSILAFTIVFCMYLVVFEDDSKNDIVSKVIMVFAFNSYVSHLYFLSCSSLPPKTKKKTEKLPADLVLEGGLE